jgi:uroporphyrinogen decarboxylase
VFGAFVERQNEFYVALLERCCAQARGVADICWLGDDYATQRALMMSPELWRRFLKEPLRRQVEVAHRHDLYALLHSCGAVRAILPDLIDIGVDGLLTFQTSAAGMDAGSIARDFGGQLVFYGGIDCQQLLTFGSEGAVRREVRKNMDLFAGCGGYVVANSHHGIANIRPENVVAMLSEARRYFPARARMRR